MNTMRCHVKCILMTILFTGYLMLAIFLVNHFEIHNSSSVLMESLELGKVTNPLPFVYFSEIQARKNYVGNLSIIRGTISQVLDIHIVWNATENITHIENVVNKGLSYINGLKELDFNSKVAFLRCNVPEISLLKKQSEVDVFKEKPLYAVKLKNGVYQEFFSNFTLDYCCSPFSHMSFMKFNASRFSVALASIPGSGNSLLRYYIEQVTGIFSGSTSCDVALKRVGHLGEGVFNSQVSVVRSNEPYSNLSVIAVTFRRAILLLRNPYAAILAEYNRIVTQSYVAKLPLHHYSTNFTHWNVTAYDLIGYWYHFVMSWLTSTDQVDLCVVDYNTFKNDKRGQLQRILKFLNLPFEEEKLECALGEHVSPFKVKSSDRYLAQANPYTLEQAIYLNRFIRTLAPRLADYDIPYYTWFKYV